MYEDAYGRMWFGEMIQQRKDQPVGERGEFGNMVIALYRPKEGKDAELREQIRGHLPTLRRLGLATEREALLLLASDGAYLEIFEWVSVESVEAAHTHPEVAGMWEDFGKVCDFVSLSDLADAGRPFPHFQPVVL